MGVCMCNTSVYVVSMIHELEPCNIFLEGLHRLKIWSEDPGLILAICDGYSA